MSTALFAGDVDWVLIATALISTVLLAWLSARLARRVAAVGFDASIGGALAANATALRGPLRVVFFTTLAVVAALLAFPALDLAGLHPLIGRSGLEIVDWILGSGLRVALIALVAYALVRSTDFLVRRFELQVSGGATLEDREHAKRARTLGSALKKASASLIVGTAAVMILNEIGVNIAPVLTGAGIAGVALGFGAQTLVRDFLSGFFLLLEDQVRVADLVAINGTTGSVEQLNIRTIVLRDADGSLHVFPNGSITTLANHSRDFSYYIIDVNIAYDEDADRVSDIVREVDREMRNDPELAPHILNPVEILGVAAFSEWSMQLRIRIKTTPPKRWAVGREFRKRLRTALNKYGIAVPYPATLRPPL
jgi:moderate conductance mechanosensitive channel